jgi:hypothetical protein
MNLKWRCVFIQEESFWQEMLHLKKILLKVEDEDKCVWRHKKQVSFFSVWKGDCCCLSNRLTWRFFYSNWWGNCWTPPSSQHLQRQFLVHLQKHSHHMWKVFSEKEVQKSRMTSQRKDVLERKRYKLFRVRLLLFLSQESLRESEVQCSRQGFSFLSKIRYTFDVCCICSYSRSLKGKTVLGEIFRKSLSQKSFCCEKKKESDLLLEDSIAFKETTWGLQHNLLPK